MKKGREMSFYIRGKANLLAEWNTWRIKIAKF